ncbi:MAG: sulfotransferase [Pseudomonadota bacterium]
MNAPAGRAALFHRVIESSRRGDPDAMQRAGDALLAAVPGDPAALGLVGTLACQAGEVARGCALLLEALGIAPGNADLRRNAAKGLFDLGRLDEAEALCGDDATGMRLKAEIAGARGDLGGAIGGYEAAVAAAPGDAEAWNNLANALSVAGEHGRAIEAAERAAALDTRPRLLLNLAATLGRAGEDARCVAVLRAAPGDAEAWLALGRALNRMGRSRDALAPLAAAARAAPGDPATLVAVGLTQANLGDFAAAERGYRAALAAEPGFAPAVVNLGILLEQSNRIDELHALVGGDAAAPAYLRAQLARHAGRFAEALALAETVGDEVDTSLRAQLIGQLAERLGQAGTAFAAFAAMNRAVAADPASRGVDAAGYRAGIEARTARLTPARVAAWRPVEIDTARAAPVFLIGFPRSGTTLLDTILMGHPGVTVLEEEPVLQQVQDMLGDSGRLGDLSSEEANALRARYFEALDALRPGAGGLLIDKLPLNIVRAELIHRIFPDARFVLALRDPRDAVLSCFMQNFKINAAMANFLDLGDAARLYGCVFRHWQRCAELLPLKAHALRYEDLLVAPEAALWPLVDFLGLDWDDRLLAHTDTAARRGIIRTPSYGQVTEPLYHRAAGRWVRYRDAMAGVLPLLDPWVKRWGYSV